MPEEALSQDAIDRLLRDMAEGKSPIATAPEKGTAVGEPAIKKPMRGGTQTQAKSEPTVANRRIRDYDFRRPNRISKEHMRGLRLIHETFSREIPRVWGPLVRAGSQVKLTSMEQTIYDEYKNHLSPHCFICTATMHPLEGEIVFHIELEPTFIILDRLLGGAGTGLKRTRELTMLELNLMQRVISVLLPLWREAWLPTIRIEPAIARTLSSTEFLQLTAVNESVLLATFQARFLNTDIEMSICIPYANIAPILTRINSSESGAGNVTGDAMDRMNLMRQVQDVRVEATARLGAAPIPISQLSRLEVGDVIRLDTPTTGTGILHISGKPHFVIRPGLSKDNLAVQITEIIRN